MSDLRVGMVGFDITPRIHPEFGAWGTTHTMTSIDMPLLARCVVLEQDAQRLIWYGSDLIGERAPKSDALRDEIAEALDLQREQIIWSTSQTHSSGALPGSAMTGSSVCDLSRQDPEFAQQEGSRFMQSYIDAAKQAIDQLQPATILAGRGVCDSMSYNRRLPMPTGGVKFSRHHLEGLQSGKFFDPTIGLLRFEDRNSNPIGAIFNFGCHPATMINNSMVSPDWVGTARQFVEEAISGAPAMFVQGFLGDVLCYHIFGTPAHAKRTGARLGKAAAEAMHRLIPARTAPLGIVWKTIELPCRPMFTAGEFEDLIAICEGFINEMRHDPAATWVGGINLPEHFSIEDRILAVKGRIAYAKKGLHMLNTGEDSPSALPITLGALRIGDVAATFSPGEPFTITGQHIRKQSPFVHTLVCGDTNGIFGYMATDDEIDRGGYEPDSFWTSSDGYDFKLPPAKGLAGRTVKTAVELLWELH